MYYVYIILYTFSLFSFCSMESLNLLSWLHFAHLLLIQTSRDLLWLTCPSTQIEFETCNCLNMSFLMEVIVALCCLTVLLDASGDTISGLRMWMKFEEYEIYKRWIFIINYNIIYLLQLPSLLYELSNLLNKFVVSCFSVADTDTLEGCLLSAGRSVLFTVSRSGDWQIWMILYSRWEGSFDCCLVLLHAYIQLFSLHRPKTLNVFHVH